MNHFIHFLNNRGVGQLSVVILLLFVTSLEVTAQIPPPPVTGADKDTSGCTSLPGDGSPNTSEICYRASVGIHQHNTNGFQFWMHTRNVSNDPISFSVCAMVNRKAPAASLQRYTITPNGSGGWTCAQNGQSTFSQGYHFSCKHVNNLAPGATTNPFDVFANLGVPVTASDLTTIYWDLLAGGPVDSNCQQVVGVNKWLVPIGGSQSQAVNIWVGGSGPVVLDPVVFRVIDWARGNWFTMAYPGIYQARLVGTVFDAPEDTTLVLRLGEEQHEFRVEPERFEFEIPTVLNSEIEEFGSVQIITTGGIEEGQWISFRGQVFSTEDNELYATDDFMYEIAANFVMDTQPPIIEGFDISVNEVGFINVILQASDEASLPAAAALVVVVDGDEVVQSFPINFSPESTDEEMFFQDTISFADQARRLAEAGSSVEFFLEVTDEVGNSTRTEMMDFLEYVR